MSLGEIVLLLLVGIIVVGPRNLPTMMRTAGQWVAKLRRMSTDLRSQSGIDDLLRNEGLDEHIQQLRSLSRLNVVDTLMAPAPGAPRTPATYPSNLATTTGSMESARSLEWKRHEPLREREYPLAGCDAGGALPDDASPYHPTPAANVVAADIVAPVAPAPEPLVDTAPEALSDAERTEPASPPPAEEAPT